MFTILNNEEATLQIPKLVVDLLADVRLEVRQMASTVLSGLIHCKFIQAEDKLLVRIFVAFIVLSSQIFGCALFYEVDEKI